MPTEELIRDGCASLDDGSNLMPVDQLRDVGTAMADELRNLVDRHAGIGEQRDERVAQFTRGPVGRVEPGHQAQRATQVAADVGGTLDSAVRAAGAPPGPLSSIQWAGMVLGFAGGLLILSRWRADAPPLAGLLACLGASASYGLSYVYMGRYLTNRGLPPLVLSTGQLIAASGLLRPCRAVRRFRHPDLASGRHRRATGPRGHRDGSRLRDQLPDHQRRRRLSSPPPSPTCSPSSPSSSALSCWPSPSPSNSRPESPSSSPESPSPADTSQPNNTLSVHCRIRL